MKNDFIEVTFKVGGYEFKEKIEFDNKMNFAVAWKTLLEYVQKNLFLRVIETMRNKKGKGGKKSC